MKIKKLMLMVGVVGSAFVVAGCGSGPQGTYNVTVSMPGAYGQCASSQMQLNIAENGNAVTGTGSNSCFSSFTLNGTDSGNGQLTNVTLNFSLSSQALGMSTGGSAGGYGGSCNFTGGTLNVGNNAISGSITSTQGMYSSGCPTTSVSLTGTEN